MLPEEIIAGPPCLLADATVPIVVVGITAVVFIVWIVLHHAAEMTRAYQRERSRREIAAYVAEGTMTTAEGQALLDAGASPTKT